jgi:nitrous oxide reductase
MSQDQDKKAASRRQFFKAAGLGAVAAGAGTLGALAPAVAAEASPEINPGYSETAHVKTYYALAK